MIDLSRIKQVYVFTGKTDFRLGIYGLTKQILQRYEKESINGNLYIFCATNKKSIKAIEFNKYGTWLYQNKVDIGKIIYPETGETKVITKDELLIILEGMNVINRIEEKKVKKYDEY